MRRFSLSENALRISLEAQIARSHCRWYLHSILVANGGAQTAADEAEHSDEGHDPDGESHVEVIGHTPLVTIAHGFLNRAGADSVVFGEHHDASGNQGTELEQADAEGAPDGADSGPPSPGADEHEDSIQGDQSIYCGHEASDGSELRASSLAIDVTILKQVNPVLQEVPVQVLVSPVHTTIHFD